VTVYIYGLWEPGEKWPRYVGSTKNLWNRLNSHYGDTRHKEKHKWLTEGKARLVVLQMVKCKSRQEGYNVEFIWIRRYKPIYNTKSKGKERPFSIRQRILESF